MQNNLHIAQRFATALDREDYAVAKSLLGDKCEYLCRGERYQGPTAIIASYQANGGVAKQFDAVEYESDVDSVSGGQFRIRFRDHLTQRGRQHTFRCDQIIEMNASGLINRIEHVDLPGEVKALQNFKRLGTDREPEVE